MPLDTTQSLMSRLEVTRGYVTAFSFASEKLEALGDNASDYETMAQAAFDAWSCVASLPASDLMLVRFARNQAMVSRRGGVVVIGQKELNAGIMRQAFKNLPAMELAKRAEVSTEGWSPVQHMTWALAERFGRVEAPRVFEMMLGSYEYVVEVEKNRFAIVDEDGGAERLLAKIAEAAKAEHAVEFTLGEVRPRDRRSEHPVSAFFGRAADNAWAFDQNGWPEAVPQGTAFEDIKVATALSRSVAGCKGDFERVDVLDQAGQRKLSLTADESGHVLNWHYSEPECSPET